jgi:hypothetical protein
MLVKGSLLLMSFPELKWNDDTYLASIIVSYLLHTYIFGEVLHCFFDLVYVLIVRF